MRLLIALPLLLLLVSFALSNTADVRLGLWPTDLALEMPVSLVVIGAMAVAFLVGGLLVWISELAVRRRARHAEQTVRFAGRAIAGVEGQADAAVDPAARGLERSSCRPACA